MEWTAAASSGSKSISNWPDSACHWRTASRVATSLPMARIRTPVSGASCPLDAFNLESAREMLRLGICASCNELAVRSMTMSWNVKRYSRRAPRLGVTTPSAISRAATERGMPSKAWTSRIV